MIEASFRLTKAARTEAAEARHGPGGEESGSTGASWLLRVLYAILIVSAAALLILLLGDIVAAVEAGTGGELHDLFVFDLAWPVFLIGSLATVTATWVAGRAREAQLGGHGALCYADGTEFGANADAWHEISGWWATLDSNQ